MNAVEQKPHPTSVVSAQCLVHTANQGVDVFFPVTQVATLHEVQELARPEAAVGVAELERPEEVARLLEVGADRVDLVDEVLHAVDDGVVGERDALLVGRLGVSALVDELTDGLEVGVAVGDEGLDNLQHLGGGLGQTDEDTVVDLEKTEELESLALLGVDLVDTLDADDEGEARLGWDVVGAFLLGDAGETDLLALCIAVLLDVGLGTLEDLLALLLRLLLTESASAFDMNEV